VVPAWLAAHEDPIAALKSGVGRASPSTARLRKGLVVTQIGLAFVLLTGAGLLLRSIANLNAVPLGYNTEGILSFSVSLHGAPYVTAEHTTSSIASFYSNVLDRLRALPGVDAAAAIDMPPLERSRADMLLPVTAGKSDRSSARAAMRFTSPGYFRLMGIALQQGREFTSQDTHSARSSIASSIAINHQRSLALSRPPAITVRMKTPFRSISWTLPSETGAL